MNQREVFDFINNLHKIGITSITVRDKKMIKATFQNVDKLDYYPEYYEYDKMPYHVAGIRIEQDEYYERDL